MFESNRRSERSSKVSLITLLFLDQNRSKLKKKDYPIHLRYQDPLLLCCPLQSFAGALWINQCGSTLTL